MFSIKIRTLSNAARAFATVSYKTGVITMGKNSFFNQSNFNPKLMLDQAFKLQSEKSYLNSRAVFYKLDNSLTEEDLNVLTEEQRKKLADLYIEIGDLNFRRGMTSDDKDDDDGREAFLYLQKAKKLDPEKTAEIDRLLLGMWAETRPDVLFEKIRSGEWPSAQIEANMRSPSG